MFDRSKKIAADLANRIRLSITKAIVESIVDSTAIQTVKLDALTEEVFDKVERPQNYGLTSNPPADSEAVLGEIGGSRDNPIVIIVENSANRPKNLNAGEVILWALFGQRIKHASNGNTEFTANKFLFNSGGRSGARVDDEIESNIIDEPAFWGWVAAVSAFVNGITPGTITTVPTSLIGKITTGSASTELPND